MADVEPGLLEVAQGARGVQSLGAGLSVALYDSGFRLARGSTVLADTVTRGAPVTAVMGSLDDVNGHPREQVTGTLMHVRIDAVRRVKDTVRYNGVVHDDRTSLPLRIDFQPIDGRIRMDAAVPGAEAVAIHLDWRPRRPASPPPCPSRTCASGPTGSTPRSSTNRRSPGCSAPTCRSARCRCHEPSTCARTAGSRCTCGLLGPW